MKYNTNAMKFGSQSKSSSLIIIMIFDIADLDPKLNSWEDLALNCNVLDFYEIWHSEQIEHANHEYINQN